MAPVQVEVHILKNSPLRQAAHRTKVVLIVESHHHVAAIFFGQLIFAVFFLFQKAEITVPLFFKHWLSAFLALTSVQTLNYSSYTGILRFHKAVRQDSWPCQVTKQGHQRVINFDQRFELFCIRKVILHAFFLIESLDPFFLEPVLNLRLSIPFVVWLVLLR